MVSNSHARILWGLDVNDGLLAIDRWFSDHGHTVPDEPRAELEGHLRGLSERIAGYPGFLAKDGGTVASNHDHDLTGFAGRNVADPTPSIPVHAFGELAGRAEARRAAAAAEWAIFFVVIAVVLGVGGWLVGGN